MVDSADIYFIQHFADICFSKFVLFQYGGGYRVSRTYCQVSLVLKCNNLSCMWWYICQISNYDIEMALPALRISAVRTGTLMHDVYTIDRYHRLCFPTVLLFSWHHCLQQLTWHKSVKFPEIVKEYLQVWQGVWIGCQTDTQCNLWKCFFLI